MNINIVTIALLLSSVCFTKAQDVRQFFTTHNTIAFDDATLRYEQEGRVLVGDVLTIEQSLQFGDSRFPVSTSDYSAAAKTIVSGGNWINVNQGSVLTIDENKGNFNMNSKGQKVTGQKAWDTNLASYGFKSMKQIKSEFETLSDYLATLPMTGTFDSKDQNSYKIIGNGKDVSVVNITQEDLANARGLELSVPGKGLLIVNVSGKDPTFNANFIGSSGEYASNVLWNFADAESVTANRRVEGAGLAPNATGKFNDGYEGSWILNTLAYMGGEGHFRPLLGLTIPSIPVPKPEPEPTPPAPLPPTPEPPAPAPPTPAPVSQVPEGGPGILLLTILASGLGCLRKR